MKIQDPVQRSGQVTNPNLVAPPVSLKSQATETKNAQGQDVVELSKQAATPPQDPQTTQAREQQVASERTRQTEVKAQDLGQQRDANYQAQMQRTTQVVNTLQVQASAQTQGSLNLLA